MLGGPRCVPVVVITIWLLFGLGTANQNRIQKPANKEQPYANIVHNAVVRGKVALPCDITPPSSDDSVTLVLWYKDESLAPIYTLDARRGQLDQAKQSSIPELENRAYFNMMNRPAFLQLDPVKEKDAGEYRCRVDFRKGRSINTVINLKVIVPPGEPVIRDDGEKQLEGLIGRYSEGDHLRLTCEVKGGKPKPSVKWFKGGEVYDDTYTYLQDQDVVLNDLEIMKLGRDDFLMQLTCQALNNNVTVASSKSITIDMNLKPISISIQPPERPLSADKEIELVCSSSGSRPAATLTWWKGENQLPSMKELEVQEGLSSSSSVILFTPRAEDNGQILSCRAENQYIEGGVLEQGWKLEVLYSPRVSLELGQNLKEKEIQEGNDVYLECKSDANPPVSEVTWQFEGQEVTTNINIGVIVSGDSLVLQKVRRSRRGRYTCSAINKEGEGISNELFLRIKFAPSCKKGQKLIYGVSKMESINVHCELDADPEDVTFHWRFNSSSSGKRHDLDQFTVRRSHSIAPFTPKADDDFGSLLCWGSNEVGKQIKPCNFTIIPADPVNNCTQVNATEESVSFECFEGNCDGGVSPVTYTAEIRDIDSGRMWANVSNVGSPAFTFIGLPGGASFRVQVYASNVKGHRKPVNFTVHTLRPAEKLTAGSQAITIIRPVLGVLVGTVITLVIAAIVIIIFIKYKNQKRVKEHDKIRPDDKSQTLLKKDVDEFADLEERGPDIIPATPKNHFNTYEDDTLDTSGISKEPLAQFYSLPVTSNDIGDCSTDSKYSTLKKEPSEVTYAELAFSRSTPGGSSVVLRQQRPEHPSCAPTEYARIDFQRTSAAAVRPLPAGHQIPITLVTPSSSLGATLVSEEEEEVVGGSSCETPLMGNRMESTV